MSELCYCTRTKKLHTASQFSKKDQSVSITVLPQITVLPHINDEDIDTHHTATIMKHPSRNMLLTCTIKNLCFFYMWQNHANGIPVVTKLVSLPVLTGADKRIPKESPLCPTMADEIR